MTLLSAVLGLACTGSEPPPVRPAPTATSEPAPSSSGASPLAFEGGVPTNLLMISIDTLRLDQLSRWRELWPGTEPPPMPFLDGLIAGGVVLDDHTGCSNWTFHSATCTVAGADPLSWGFVPSANTDGIEAPYPPRPFLADWLGEAGFHTILATSNTLFSELYGNGTGYHSHRLTVDPGLTPALDAAALGLGLLDEALSDGIGRWFLHLHLIDPHRPYTPPEAYRQGWSEAPTPHDLDTVRGHDTAVWEAVSTATPAERDALEQHLRQRYTSTASWLDDQLAQIWADLASRDLLDDTLVVIWTDHGEQHFERGFQAHAFTLYREENDVLALFWAPNLAPGVWQGPTHATDLVPTLLELYGLRSPEGVTGVPLGQADPLRARSSFSRAKVGVVQAVQQGTDKLHLGWGDPAVDDWTAPAMGLHQHDLATDPRELHDVLDPASERTIELWSLLRPQIEAASALLPDETVHWPEGL